MVSVCFNMLHKFLSLHIKHQMGVSENRENPIFPMVLLIIIPFLNGYFIGNINPTFSISNIKLSSQKPFQHGLGWPQV